MVYALKKFHLYILGIKIVIFTSVHRFERATHIVWVVHLGEQGCSRGTKYTIAPPHHTTPRQINGQVEVSSREVKKYFKENYSTRWKGLGAQASRRIIGILHSLQDTCRDVSLPTHLRKSLPPSGWARAPSLLSYQKAQPIFGQSRETTTSPAPRVIRAKTQRVRERENLQRKD